MRSRAPACVVSARAQGAARGPGCLCRAGFPDLERLHPFDRALLQLTVGEARYTSTLGKVRGAECVCGVVWCGGGVWVMVICWGARVCGGGVGRGTTQADAFLAAHFCVLTECATFSERPPSHETAGGVWGATTSVAIDLARNTKERAEPAPWHLLVAYGDVSSRCVRV